MQNTYSFLFSFITLSTIQFGNLPLFPPRMHHMRSISMLLGTLWDAFLKACHISLFGGTLTSLIPCGSPSDRLFLETDQGSAARAGARREHVVPSPRDHGAVGSLTGRCCAGSRSPLAGRIPLWAGHRDSRREQMNFAVCRVILNDSLSSFSSPSLLCPGHPRRAVNGFDPAPPPPGLGSSRPSSAPGMLPLSV